MARISQVWHTQGPSLEEGVERGEARPECSICYSAYDNVFKTPKELECAHTFCLECLSRLRAVSLDLKKDEICCPLCRQATAVPEGGPPLLPTSLDLLGRLPPHQRQPERVCLDGQQLCYSCPMNSDSSHSLWVCIDIGASPQSGSDGHVQVLRGSPRWSLLRLVAWLLLVMVMLALIFILLWQLRCVFSSSFFVCLKSLKDTTQAPSISPLP